MGVQFGIRELRCNGGQINYPANRFQVRRIGNGGSLMWCPPSFYTVEPRLWHAPLTWQLICKMCQAHRSQFSWGHFKKCQKSMRVWQPTPIGPSTRPDRLFRTHPQDRCGYGMHGIDADGDGVGQHAGEGFWKLPRAICKTSGLLQFPHSLQSANWSLEVWSLEVLKFEVWKS